MIRCRTCNAPIEFVKMRSGKFEPVDPTPWFEIDTLADGGKRTTVVLDRGETDSGALVATHRFLPGTKLPEGHVVGRQSHFASCPNARQHRRG